MGMESFFVEFVLEGVKKITQNHINRYEGAGSVDVSPFNEKLKGLKSLKCKKYKNYFIVNGIVKLTVSSVDQKIQAIILEGCFSCYEEVIKYMFILAENIRNEMFPFRLYILGEEIVCSDITSFTQTVIKKYQCKYENFCLIYSDTIGRRILPRHFYDLKEVRKRCKRVSFE